MSAFRPIAISAAAALTPLGAAEQTAAAIRAGIARRREHPFYESILRDPAWDEDEPLVVCGVDAVAPEIEGAERLFQLLSRTLTDLAEGEDLKRRDFGSSALLVALPAPDDAIASWGLEAFVADLCRRTGLAFKAVRHVTPGHTGVFELLGEASAMLGRGEVDACFVAGVDSYLSADRLAVLDRAYRLKSRRNVDGFCPGEAAAALLVESPRRMRARGAEALGWVTALGLGQEPASFAGSDRVSTGAGLTQAIRGAGGASGVGAEWVLCDLNGESYRAFEWGVALARLGPELEGMKRLVHPVTSLGDVGAATGAVLAAVALAAARRRWAPASEALLWAASDGGARAAARIGPSGDFER